MLNSCGMQVKAREETLARDEERHQQLKEESKKQVSCLTYSVAWTSSSLLSYTRLTHFTL